MILNWIWIFSLLISLFCAWLTHRGSVLSGALLEGAQAGISLGISMAGGLCLWSGVLHLMEHCGLINRLSRLLKPVLSRLFPESREDPALAGAISANICANLLGLGNAATPMGLRAVRLLARDSTASRSLCRFVVLNTASVQLFPTTLTALRAGLGCRTPLDILPAVWITSLCAAAAGLAAVAILERLWPHD